MKKVLTRFAWMLLLATFVIAAVVGFWRPGLLRGQSNEGHQLGGDLFKELSGNTIECFEKGIENFESRDGWLYAECDIRDTKDGHLIVFHDWDISSVPNSAENQAAIGGPVSNQAICDLTLDQIQGLTLKCGCKIPTLEELLEKAVELKLKKRLLLEIKYLHTDVGRERLVELAIQYRDGHEIEIHFLAFIRNIYRSFPNAEAWLKKVSQSKFHVYQAFRPKTAEYDLCETLK